MRSRPHQLQHWRTLWTTPLYWRTRPGSCSRSAAWTSCQRTLRSPPSNLALLRWELERFQDADVLEKAGCGSALLGLSGGHVSSS